MTTFKSPHQVTQFPASKAEALCTVYLAEAFICASNTPESPQDQTPMTGQRSSGAGRGLVSPNCSKRTFALYQLSAAGHSTSALRRGGSDDKSLFRQL